MIKVGAIYKGLLSNNTFAFARQRKNSEWIYSSLSQKMAHAKLPSITIFAAPPHSTFDLTLRIKKAIQNAHILLSSNPFQTHNFLNSNQDSAENVDKGEQTSEIMISQKENSELAKRQNKGAEMDWSLELSKQLQLAIENQKIMQSNNDRQNRTLKQQQDQLLNYIQLNDFKSKLQQFKNKNGFPKIGLLSDQLKNIASWRQAGIGIICIIDQLAPHASKSLFKYLQEEQLPYEVLPTYNQLVNMLAASGFPADRFAIQYFPKSLNETFALRKQMKMTVALILNSNQLKQCLLSVHNIYGKNQLIYIQDEKGKLLYRGEAGEYTFQTLPTGIIRVAVSPYLPSFNEELNEEKNKVTQLYGESMHQNTHFVRVQLIAQQLEVLRQRKQKKEVVLQFFIKELLKKVENDEKVSKIVSKLTDYDMKKAKALVQKVKQRTVKDYIGLQKFVKKN